MPDKMTKLERLAATLSGAPVDRPAWSLWRHFYETETTPHGLAESMLAFQRTYQFDFMKVNPRASYLVEDWGVKLRFSGQPHVSPWLIDWPVKTTADWAKITALPPDRGVLGEHLTALRLIRDGLRGETPFMMTVFSPLSLAGRLAGSERALLQQISEAPDSVHQGLGAITQTLCDYARACLGVGASGLFYATTAWASRDLLTHEQYEEFGRLYDLQVLAAVQGAELNVLHVCGDNNMLLDLADYPVHAVNWAATSPTNPSIAETARATPWMLIAGISREHSLIASSPDPILAEARHAQAEAAGHRWMLGPDCSISTKSRPANIQALRTLITSGQ